MKKSLVLMVLCLVIVSMLCVNFGFVLGKEEIIEETVTTERTIRRITEDAPIKTDTDKKIKEALEKYPLVNGITYYMLGVRKIDAENIEADKYGLTSIIIIFILIWLILFLLISDTIAFVSGRPTWISWVVGFALTVVAANINVVQYITIWAINFTVIFGTISVFAGLIMAFIVFAIFTFGTAKMRHWAIARRMDMLGARGKKVLVQGIDTAMNVGRRTLSPDLGDKEKKIIWWIVGIAAFIVVILLILFSGNGILS